MLHENVGQYLWEIIKTSQRYKQPNPLQLTTKIGQEFGQLCEAVNIEMGNSKDDLKEPSVNEIADIMISCMYLLSVLKTDEMADDVLDEFIAALTLKYSKWKSELEHE